MNRLLLVGVGGFIGSVLRYLVSGWVQQASRSIDFPYGTLVVNVAGCFAIGLLAHLADTRGIFSAELRTLVFVGVLGGFTTFSTFGNESLNLARDGSPSLAAINVGAHVALGLGAAWLGRTLAYWIWR